jgi:hypothetical protein
VLLGALMLCGCATHLSTRSPAGAMVITSASVSWTAVPGSALLQSADGGASSAAVRVDSHACGLDRDAREAAFAAIRHGQRLPEAGPEPYETGPMVETRQPIWNEKRMVLIRFEPKDGETFTAMIPAHELSRSGAGSVLFNGDRLELEIDEMSVLRRVVREADCAPRVEGEQVK